MTRLALLQVLQGLHQEDHVASYADLAVDIGGATRKTKAKPKKAGVETVNQCWSVWLHYRTKDPSNKRMTRGQYTQERPSSFAREKELEDVHNEFLRAANELRNEVVDTIGRRDLLVSEKGVVAEMVGVGLSRFPTAFHVGECSLRSPRVWLANRGAPRRLQEGLARGRALGARHGHRRHHEALQAALSHAARVGARVE